MSSITLDSIQWIKSEHLHYTRDFIFITIRPCVCLCVCECLCVYVCVCLFDCVNILLDKTLQRFQKSFREIVFYVNNDIYFEDDVLDLNGMTVCTKVKKKKKNKKQEAFRERKHLHVCDLWLWVVTLTLSQSQIDLCH